MAELDALEGVKLGWRKRCWLPGQEADQSNPQKAAGRWQADRLLILILQNILCHARVLCVVQCCGWVQMCQEVVGSSGLPQILWVRPVAGGCLVGSTS